MKPWRRAWNRLLGSFFGGHREDDLSQELESHLAMQIEANQREGMTEHEARRAALITFGGVENAKEKVRDQRGLPWLEDTWNDLRYAARTLRHSPGFTIVAVLTLALGIGANTAVFSLVDQLLLHPDGIRDPERIVAIVTRYGKQGTEFQGGSAANLTDLRAARDVFEYVALSDGNVGNINYTGGEAPEMLWGAGVTAEWFDVFGARPLMGRVFTAEEDQPNRNHVVVLSHPAWTRLFGADPKVLGRKILLNQISLEVIGVMTPDFRLPREVDLWIPAGLPPQAYAPSNRFNESAFLAARLREGVTPEQAKAWLSLLTDRVHADADRGSYAQSVEWGLSLVPFIDSYVSYSGNNRTELLLLFGSVGLVLLIACSNIAGLMVARTSSRARELAVRAALGASRARLVRQVFTESLLLAAVGGALGVAVAKGTVQVLRTQVPGSAAGALDGRLDPYVLLFCMGVTVLCGIAFSLAPAWLSPRVDGEALAAGRSNTAGRARHRLRSVLIVAETAIALTLLVAAALLVRSFVRVQNVDPGIDPRGVMTAIFNLPSSAYPEILERVRAVPGVQAAGIGWPVPFSYNNQGGTFFIEGRDVRPGDPPPRSDRRQVTPGFMEALRVPLLRGRYFTDADRMGAEPVTIIDENLAQQYWPGEDPVGKRVRFGGNGQPWVTIIGVVGHVMHPDVASDSGSGVAYVSLLQRTRQGSAGIMVKTSGRPEALAGVIREAVWAVDRNQAVHTMYTMDEYLSDTLSTRRFEVRVLVFFAAAGLFLAGLGLYGVISYAVGLRVREIGIRMALGAKRTKILRMVLGQGLRLAAIGVVIGLGGAWFAGRLLRNQLFKVEPFDLPMIGGMAAVLLISSLLACLLPAQRAIRVDPAETLRHE